MKVRTAPQAGFTMIELLIVVAIGALLALIAVPSFREILYTMRQSSALGLLMSDMNMARGEAIKRNTRVLLCGRDNAGTDCGAVTDWRVGWVVCTEAAAANTCALATADNPNPFVVRPPLDSTLTLTASANTIRFNPNSSQGDGTTAPTVALAGTWAGAPTRTISVAGTGNISKQ
jgi:type IV fimbrial biogenesis protein FimT